MMCSYLFVYVGMGWCTANRVLKRPRTGKDILLFHYIQKVWHKSNANAYAYFCHYHNNKIL